MKTPFNFIKAVYFRVVKNTLKLADFKKVTQHLDLSDNRLDQAFRIIEAVAKEDPEKGDLLKAKLNQFHFYAGGQPGAPERRSLARGQN